MKIHDLRVIGTDVGVKSPTALKKEALIQAILEITEHKTIEEIQRNVQIESTKKKPGRPQKTSGIVVLKDSAAPVEETEEGKQSEILEGTIPPEQIFATPPKEKKVPFTHGKITPTRRPNSVPNTENKPNTHGQSFKPNTPPVRLPEDTEAEKPAQQEPEIIEIKEGVLEILPDGYGFIRVCNYEAGEGDAYIPAQRIKASGLRKGDWIRAEVKKNGDAARPRISAILSVNGRDPESVIHKRKNFDTLTPIYPNQRYRLEIPGSYNDFAIRCIDMIAPIGKGQRAMIVSPPKAGKTTFLKKVANSIAVNYPDSHLIVLLIDERPEEVTDMQRCIKGEVVFSTFDETPEHHTKAAEMVLERAKRLVELGEDVVILMDSLTRLARAYNLTIAPTGRTLSGGIDPGALHSPKRFFGAARNIEFGGSLTIIATALVDTGSRMDDVIYEEFKGTGNMEIHLDRRLSEKRIFPAIDLYKSSTRMEELLLDQNELQGAWAMRKLLGTGDSADATENLLNMLIKTKTNREFLEQVNLQLMSLQKQGFKF